MAKRKEMFSTLDIKHKQNRFYGRFPICDVWGGGSLLEGALIKLSLFQEGVGGLLEGGGAYWWGGGLLNFFYSRGGGVLIRGGRLKEGGRLLEDLP